VLSLLQKRRLKRKLAIKAIKLIDDDGANLHDSVLLEIVSDWSFLVDDVFELEILLLATLSKGTE